MPDSFFSTTKNRKRKRPHTKNDVTNGNGHKQGPARKSAKKASRDEDLGSSDGSGDNIDDLDLRASYVDDNTSGEEYENETPAEKRLRLAKLYLESVKEGLGEGEADAAEVDKELIASRLKQDVLQQSGKLHLFVAKDVKDGSSNPPTLTTRGHRFTVTSAVLSANGAIMFTSGKEGSIIKWDVRSGKRLAVLAKVKPDTNNTKGGKGKGKGKERAHIDDAVQGHTDEVWALALSEDGKYLASGGKDRRVVIWDAQEHRWVRTFGGHKDSISGLSFRKGTWQLYSASFDRTIKLFDLSVMGYVETLFGHQDCISSLDSLRAEVAVSAGGRDRTVRFWKIVDESQLVFRGGGRSKIREVLEGGMEDVDADEDVPRTSSKSYVEGSIDCVAMIDDTTFLSGGDSGAICLWTTQKKKPQFTHPLAHGLHEVISETEGAISTPRWITSIACLPYSDLFASGSWDGFIRLWKLDSKGRSFSALRELQAVGFVASLQLLNLPGRFLQDVEWVPKTPDGEQTSRKPQDEIVVIAALGKEMRTGRWMELQNDGAKNCTMVFAVTRSSTP